MFFADKVEDQVEDNTNKSPNDEFLQVASLDGGDTTIYNAARFMVDAFWIGSPQQLIQVTGDSSPFISESAKSALIDIQADDLMDKYGERLGKRKLDALILVALESEDGDIITNNAKLTTTDNILGLVTIEVRLMNSSKKDILSASTSEQMLTQAVSALRPQQRREYKDSSVVEIATELLPPEISAVCSLSNLCVASKARRKGVAVRLCEEAERMAREELGFEEIFLRVEGENEAASRLYETKLGYERKFEVEGGTALRVDGESGSFVEVESDIVVMNKLI